MTHTIKTQLKELGFRNNEIKVYVTLTEMGESVASRIAKRAGLPRTTVISLLEKLAREHFVSAHKYKGTTYYWIESPRVLETIFETRVQIAKDLQPLLESLYRSEADFPQAEVFDTKEAIKHFMETTISRLKNKSIIYTIDTPSAGNYDKVLTPQFSDTLLTLKKKKGVITKTLVPYGLFAGINPEKLKHQHIIIREMPRGIDFHASLWIIDDMLVNFSGKYPFAVAIHHKIIANGMRSIFSFIWNLSTSKHSDD